MKAAIGRGGLNSWVAVSKSKKSWQVGRPWAGRDMLRRNQQRRAAHCCHAPRSPAVCQRVRGGGQGFSHQPACLITVRSHSCCLQARHTGIKIVQQIAILMGCAVLPHLKSLVDIVKHGEPVDSISVGVWTNPPCAVASLAAVSGGAATCQRGRRCRCPLHSSPPPPNSSCRLAPSTGLQDENQKVKTITALTISALAEASGARSACCAAGTRCFERWPMGAVHAP